MIAPAMKQMKKAEPTNCENIAMAVVKPNWDYMGLINLKGEYVIEPDNKNIWDWKEGFAVVEKVISKIDVSDNFKNHFNGQYGFVNAQGKLITDFSYGYANSFSRGIAAVNKASKWGFIDKTGDLIIPCQFEEVKQFGEEGCPVKLGGKWGFLSREGKWILPNQFAHLSNFEYGMAVASYKKKYIENGGKILIDINGNKIIDLPDEWGWFKPVSDKLILIGTNSGFPGGRTYGFMSLDGNIVTPPQFYTNSDYLFSTGVLSEGMLTVMNDKNQYGYVNEAGELTIPIQFQYASPFKDGMAKVKKDGNFYFIDKKGNMTSYVEPQTIQRPFDEVLEFSEGLAVARKGDLWGVIDEQNSVVIDFKYQRRNGRRVEDRGLFFSEYFPKFSCGVLGIQEEFGNNINSGYLDKNGELAIELKFRMACPFVLNGGE